MVLPPCHCRALPHGSAVFAGRRWAQWGNHTWKPCLSLITRTELDWQCWVCVLSPPPPLLPLHPAIPGLALKQPWNYIFTLQYFGQTQGIYFCGKGFPNISCKMSPQAALAGQGGCISSTATSTPIRPGLVVFVLLSHLYLFKRPDKANICDALFILWLSLEHIKLIITSYKPEIGIFLLASVDSK